MRNIYSCRNLAEGAIGRWGEREQNKVTGFQILPPPGQAMVEGHGHQFCPPIHLAWMEATPGNQNSAHKKTALRQS
jgi:hypothetical protein